MPNSIARLVVFSICVSAAGAVAACTARPTPDEASPELEAAPAVAAGAETPPVRTVESPDPDPAELSSIEEKPPRTKDGEPFSPYTRAEHPTEVFWGETHLHTANSTDAVGSGNRLTPENATRFARGDEVMASSGQPARLGRPLDFVVVTDHAEGLGIGVKLLEGYEEKTGGQVLAIPHNGNLSNDELAGYGIVGWDNGNLTLQELETAEMRPAEYAREALKQGLLLEDEFGTPTPR